MPRSTSPDDGTTAVPTIGQVARDQARTDAPPPPGLRPLVDCPACDGRGVMTARSESDLAGQGTSYACPTCEGRGAMLLVRTIPARS